MEGIVRQLDIAQFRQKLKGACAIYVYIDGGNEFVRVDYRYLDFVLQDIGPAKEITYREADSGAIFIRSIKLIQ